LLVEIKTLIKKMQKLITNSPKYSAPNKSMPK
jgi:hypothetical protein